MIVGHQNLGFLNFWPDQNFLHFLPNQNFLYLFLKIPTTRMRLKNPRPTKPRKPDFLTQKCFIVFSPKNNSTKVSYPFSKKPTQPKFIILSWKKQPPEFVWKNLGHKSPRKLNFWTKISYTSQKTQYNQNFLSFLKKTNSTKIPYTFLEKPTLQVCLREPIIRRTKFLILFFKKPVVLFR